MRKHFTPRALSAWALLGLAGLLAGQPATAQAQTKSTKRGEAYGYNSSADLKVLAPGLSWWYNWSPVPDAAGAASVYQSLGVEFVPMQWGSPLDGATVTADKLAAKIPAGAKYLLGFNEPNFKSQANLTPRQAAALWPVLQDVAKRKGLKLVSPAVNYCGDCVQENGTTYSSPVAYLDAFFAACPSCQVDYIAVHTYVCEEQYLRQKIAELKKYNKPIWVTEFACGDMDQSKITSAVQQKYLVDAVNYLENEPAVFRYAWFSGRNSEIPNINLLGADGQLTALGQLYVGQPYTGSPLLAGRLTPVAATASSTEKSEVAPARAIDGDINTRWASAWSDPQYLQVDYGSVQKIAHVRISWEAGYATDYQLQTSTDGTSWITLKTVTGGDGGVDDFTGLTGSGRYLRVQGTRRGTSYGYSIYELNAYGPGTTAATPAPTFLEAESYSSMSGVGTETTSDTGGGQDVGWIDTGDKLTYNNVTLPSTGTYTIEYRVASPSGGSLVADLNGATLGSTVTLPATGGWQKWATVTQTVTATAGTYNLTLKATAGGWNINWLRITSANASTSSTARLASTALAAAELAATDSPELEVYPNPATDHLQLRTATSLAGSHYQILNALGQVIASGAADAGSLNVSGLKAGLYTLQLTAAGQPTRSRRFQK